MFPVTGCWEHFLIKVMKLPDDNALVELLFTIIG
jgi:hypothetical protein